MSTISQLLIRLSQKLDPYLVELAMAQITAVLVIYGGELARYFRNLLKPNPFIIRVTGFILLNAFGFGLVTIFGARLLNGIYHQLSELIRMPVIFSIFLLIGILAERKKQI
jgi:hypothetical protein